MNILNKLTDWFLGKICYLFWKHESLKQLNFERNNCYKSWLAEENGVCTISNSSILKILLQHLNWIFHGYEIKWL